MFDTTRGGGRPPHAHVADSVLACLCLLVSFGVAPARAQDAGTSSAPAATLPGDSGAAPASIFAQSTYVTQWHPSFNSPYRGPLSLDPSSREAETFDATLFLGTPLWRGAAAYIDPEIDQGFGLSNTNGVAGFPSGEAYKIGANAPYLRIPRAFIRQVLDLGGDEHAIDAAPNQVQGTSTANNVTLTFGKFSVVDLFDTNDYAHDPRADFLNWAVIDSGAFDYAADSWAFTYGGALEWTEDWWTVRSGIFDMSTIPNGKQPDPRFAQFEGLVELEERHQWLGRPGKLKLLVFANHARMGNYSDALALARLTGTVPSVAAVRHYQTRDGIGVNFQQELTDDLGVFLRASANDGTKESYEFTDINRSLSTGLSLHGDRWGRHDDTVGFALVANAISNEARAYFNAGGLGILIGDGKLNYGPEEITEAYYSLHPFKGVTLTLDYQWVDHPAYNRDRGPVSIMAVRVHAEI